jgi:hypothetical protein
MARTHGLPLTLAVRRPAAPLGLAVGGALVAGGLAVRLLSLDNLGFSICTFKLWTGLPCPSCGSTRALGCLAHLDVFGAFAMNPLATLAAAAIALWAAADLVLLPTGRSLALGRAPATHPWLLRILVGVLVLNWAYLIAAGR